MRLLLLFLAGLVTGAEAACPVPKTDMRVADGLIQTNRVAGIDVTNIVMAYPSDVAGQVCCTRSVYDRREWQVILDAQIPRGTVSVLDFVAGINAPGSTVPLTDAERVICQAMADRILTAATPVPIPPAVPALYIVVAAISGQTSRPLYDASFATIGRVEFLLNGAPRVCEPTPVLKTGSTIKYYWVTNNAGQRGLAVCKPS